VPDPKPVHIDILSLFAVQLKGSNRTNEEGKAQSAVAPKSTPCRTEELCPHKKAICNGVGLQRHSFGL